MTQKKPFFLTEAEKMSPVWGKLLAHLKEKLETARTTNERMQMSDKERMEALCTIKVYKDLIKLHEPPQPGRYDDVG